MLACVLAPGPASYAATQAPSVAIHYRLAKASDVSINIYGSDGNVVRELLHGAKRQAGENTESWDALDESGKPVAPGAK